MKSINLFLGCVALFHPFSLSVAVAQSTDGFSQCVIKLDNSGFWQSDAVEHCKDAYKGRPVNEDFSTCVTRLDDSGFWQSDAVKHCKDAFANSASHVNTPVQSIRPQNQAPGTLVPVRVNGSPLIVVPSGRSNVPQPRKSTRQCVNKSLNQVWNDIHCQHNNGMFEWRTVYFD